MTHVLKLPPLYLARSHGERWRPMLKSLNPGHFVATMDGDTLTSKGFGIPVNITHIFHVHAKDFEVICLRIQPVSAEMGLEISIL